MLVHTTSPDLTPGHGSPQPFLTIIRATSGLLLPTQPTCSSQQSLLDVGFQYILFTWHFAVLVLSAVPSCLRFLFVTEARQSWRHTLLRGIIVNRTYDTKPHLYIFPIYTKHIWSYLLWSPVNSSSPKTFAGHFLYPALRTLSTPLLLYTSSTAITQRPIRREIGHSTTKYTTQPRPLTQSPCNGRHISVFDITPQIKSLPKLNTVADQTAAIPHLKVLLETRARTLEGERRLPFRQARSIEIQEWIAQLYHPHAYWAELLRVVHANAGVIH